MFFAIFCEKSPTVFEKKIRKIFLKFHYSGVKGISTCKNFTAEEAWCPHK